MPYIVPGNPVDSQVIKSIQRGYFYSTASTYAITISPVDTSKTVVLINGGIGYGGPSNSAILPYFYSITPNVLTIAPGGYGGTGNGYISWQLIEFA